MCLENIDLLFQYIMYIFAKRKSKNGEKSQKGQKGKKSKTKSKSKDSILKKPRKICQRKKSIGADTPFSGDSQTALENMVRFILQEGLERADAIDARAEEEYNIIRGDDFQKGRLKINAQYALKEQQMVIHHHTQDTAVVNAARIRLIEEKENHIRDLVEDIREQIRIDMSNNERYKSILILLIIEGLYLLLEKNVFIKCREKDQELITSILPECQKIYETNTKLKLTMTINPDHYLPCASLGGVILYIEKYSKISVNNTLDSRVDQIVHFSTPIISRCIFGTRELKR